MNWYKGWLKLASPEAIRRCGNTRRPWSSPTDLQERVKRQVYSVTTRESVRLRKISGQHFCFLEVFFLVYKYELTWLRLQAQKG